MIDYGLFSFATPPLTGEGWWIKAAQIVGLGTALPDRVHNSWPPNYKDNLRVTQVCHPVSWLRAFFDQPWNGCSPLVGIKADSFESFVRQYLIDCPGVVSRLFGLYRADVVQRAEDQPHAFWQFAETMGVSEVMYGNLLNLNPPYMLAFGTPRWIYNEVRQAEPDLFDAYDYW